MPFITAGDPDLDFTAQVLREVVGRGSSLCELGIPYSDPIADGPVIQASYTRALGKQVKLAEIFEMLAGLGPELAAPLVTMVSYAIIYRHGLEAYVRAAKAAGVSRRDRARPARRGGRPTGRSLPPRRLQPDSARHADHAPRAGQVDRRPHYRLPLLCLGDGHYRRADRAAPGDRWTTSPGSARRRPCRSASASASAVRSTFACLAPVADGLIVGSAIVRRIAEASQRPRPDVLREIGDYVRDLLAALEG